VGGWGDQLFHLTERSVWEAARRSGEYRMSTRGVSFEDAGFVHCALRHQVRGVAERYFADAEDLVLLVIDRARLTTRVEFEAAESGAEPFPHIYAPLPLAAVRAVVSVPRDGDGRLVLPD
jgi:uncharacterized protein (DUF952 family)